MEKKVRCEVCGAVIPKERLEFLPDTKTCVKCSQTSYYSQDEVLGAGLGSAAELDPMSVEDYEIDDSPY